MRCTPHASDASHKPQAVVSVTSSLGLNNLLEWFTEIREILTYIYQFMKGQTERYESTAR